MLFLSFLFSNKRSSPKGKNKPIWQSRSFSNLNASMIFTCIAKDIPWQRIILNPRLLSSQAWILTKICCAVLKFCLYANFCLGPTKFFNGQQLENMEQQILWNNSKCEVGLKLNKKWIKSWIFNFSLSFYFPKSQSSLINQRLNQNPRPRLINIQLKVINWQWKKTLFNILSTFGSLWLCHSVTLWPINEKTILCGRSNLLILQWL